MGGDFAQQTLSDNLHTDFVAKGGFGLQQLVAMVAAVVLSYVVGPEMLAAFNALIDPIALAATSSTLAVLGSAAATGLAVGTTALISGAASQLIATGGLNVGQLLEGEAVSGLTAGLTQGLLGSTGMMNWGTGATQAESGITLSNIRGTAINIGERR